MHNSDREDGLTTDQMLYRAQQQEDGVIPRRLEEFRTDGLMPPTHRIGQQGRTPIYAYPIGAEQQLDALIEWRRSIRNPDWLRVLMWVDGWAIDLDRVHISLTVLIREIRDELRQGLAKLGAKPDSDDPTGITEAAWEITNRRKDNTLIPRRRGVSPNHRAQTVELILRTYLDNQAVTVDDPRARQALADIRGNPRKARKNKFPEWTVDSSQPLFGDPDIVGLDRLVEAVETADHAELQEARRLANLMVVALPVAGAMSVALFGSTGSPLDLMQRRRDQYVLYPYAVAASINFRRNELARTDELAGSTAVMVEQFRHLVDIADMPYSELQDRYADNPEQLEQLLSALSEIDLDGIKSMLDHQGPDGTT